MLKRIAQKGYYSFHEKFDNWQDAIKASVEPLIQSNVVNPEYAQSIINCINEYGPYVVIAPNICIPHAEDKDNVNKTEIAFMKTDIPVNFSDDPEQAVQLFFVLASNNEEKHLENLRNLMKMMMNEDLMESLAKVSGEEEFLSIVDQLA